MANWEVKKYIARNGKCPFDKWRSQKISDRIRAEFDNRIRNMMKSESFPPEWFKKYRKGTWEIKFQKYGECLRPLCASDQKLIVILIGVIKRGEITEGELDSAVALMRQWEKDKSRVKDYFDFE